MLGKPRRQFAYGKLIHVEPVRSTDQLRPIIPPITIPAVSSQVNGRKNLNKQGETLLGHQVDEATNKSAMANTCLETVLSFADNIQLLRRSAEDPKHDAKQWAVMSGKADPGADTTELDREEVGEVSRKSY
jgi:hypothetical protein